MDSMIVVAIITQIGSFVTTVFALWISYHSRPPRNGNGNHKP